LRWAGETGGEHRHSDTRSSPMVSCDLVHMLGGGDDERVSLPQASSEPSERGRQGLLRPIRCRPGIYLSTTPGLRILDGRPHAEGPADTDRDRHAARYGRRSMPG
jgi:hypothetical protein